MLIRLDPWQNIVGVAWGGPPAFPILRDSMTAKDETEGTTLSLNAAPPDLFEDVDVGDTLIALVASDHVEGPAPLAEVTITGPSGWDQIYQRSAFFDAPTGFLFTASAWSRIKQAGDPDSWQWNFSPASAARTGILMRITGSKLVSSVVAQDTDESDFSSLTIAPSISPGVQNSLLLAFIDASSSNVSRALYPPAPGQRLAIIHKSFGTPDGHGQVVYEEDFPGPGATGTRTMSIGNAHFEIVGHIAIAPAT